MSEPVTATPVYVVLPGSPVNNHWHGVRFLTQDQLREDRLAGQVQADARVMRLDDPALHGRHWLCADWEILSTADVLERFAGGVQVNGYTGPHDTRTAASDCADAAWEAPG